MCCFTWQLTYGKVEFQLQSDNGWMLCTQVLQQKRNFLTPPQPHPHPRHPKFQPTISCMTIVISYLGGDIFLTLGAGGRISVGTMRKHLYFASRHQLPSHVCDNPRKLLVCEDNFFCWDFCSWIILLNVLVYICLLDAHWSWKELPAPYFFYIILLPATLIYPKVGWSDSRISTGDIQPFSTRRWLPGKINPDWGL